MADRTAPFALPSTGLSSYITKYYITTFTGDVIDTKKTTDLWGVSFFPLAVTR